MNDLISRQAAIDLLKQMRKDGDMIPWEGKDVFARIRKLPSAQPEECERCMMEHTDEMEKLEAELAMAQPERIKGRWEQDGHHIKCDQCGEWMCDRDREGWNIPKNYCPNCGADMRGEQDE